MQTTTRRSRRLAVLSASVLLAVSTIAASVGSTALAAQRIGLDDFMTGLACVESSGRFTAFNAASSAYGKYQVMPRNWVAWARYYLGNRWAPPTPRNQEYVVRERIIDLFMVHPSWRNVAHWWLTGDADSSEKLWSNGSLGYVNRVMTIAAAAATPALSAGVPAACFPTDLPLPTIRTEPFPHVRVTGGAVNVRRAAGYEFRTVTVVRRGQILAVLDRATDPRGKPWLRVGLWDGRTGWIASWLAKPTGR
jgi:Bacterial SH3 domain